MPHEELLDVAALAAVTYAALRRRCFYHESPALFKASIKRTLFPWCDVCRKRLEQNAREVDAPEFMTSSELWLCEEVGLP